MKTKIKSVSVNQCISIIKVFGSFVQYLEEIDIWLEGHDRTLINQVFYPVNSSYLANKDSEYSLYTD